MNNKEKLYLAKTAFEFRDSLKSFARDNESQLPKAVAGAGGGFVGGAAGGALGGTAGLLYGALKKPDEEEDESRMGNALKLGLGGVGLGTMAGAGIGGYMGYNSDVAEVAGDQFKELMDQRRTRKDMVTDFSLYPEPFNTTDPVPTEKNDGISHGD
jgi:hypothetical protein